MDEAFGVLKFVELLHDDSFYGVSYVSELMHAKRNAVQPQPAATPAIGGSEGGDQPCEALLLASNREKQG
jgi:hypothetical protein